MNLEGLDIYRSRCGIGKGKGHRGLLTHGCSVSSVLRSIEAPPSRLPASPWDADHPQPGRDEWEVGSDQIKHESLPR